VLFSRGCKVRKPIATIFLALLAGSAMAQTGGSSGGAGAGGTAGSSVGIVTTVAVAVVALAAAGRKNDTTSSH
jgi:hypothetical protein